MLNVFTRGHALRAVTFALAALVFLSGCVNQRVSALEMIENMNKINSSERAQINILWYKGSDAKFDHFGYVYSMTGSINLKVPSGEFTLPRMDITDDETKWVRIRAIKGLWSASWRYEGKWEPDETGITIELQQQK